jgi:hypothetical protein
MEDTMSNAITDAAALRRKAHEQWQNDDRVRALLEERQGYVQRADAAEDADDEKLAARLRSRVAQVDEQLEARGAADQIPGADAEPKRRTARKAADKGTGANAGATS